jgi:hypothetical protein
VIDHLGALQPSYPPSITEWLHLFAITLAGVVKVFRGRVMHRRARRIDFFGWSIISFDYVFGAILVIGAIWVFYPRLHTEWFDLSITFMLLAVSLWQGYTVYMAPVHRIDRAISISDSDHPGDSETNERRSDIPRREIDRQEKAELDMYRQMARQE